MAQTPGRIRQLVWMTLKTVWPRVDTPLPAVADWMQLPLPGSVSLAKLDADKLAWILHPRFRRELEEAGKKVPIFGETVAFPLHDVWGAARGGIYIGSTLQRVHDHEDPLWALIARPLAVEASSAQGAGARVR